MKIKGLILAQSGQELHGSPMDRRGTRHMLPVANKPILFHALESMAGAGITDVAIAVTADAERMISKSVGCGAPWGMRVSYAPTDDTDCVAAGLLAAEAFLDGHPFVVQHGDGLLRHDLGALLGAVEDEEPSDAVLLVHPTARADGPRLCRVGGARLRAVPDDLSSTGRLAMAGVQIFGGDFLRRAADHIRGVQPVADLATLAAGLARSTASVSVRSIEGWRRYDGDPNVLLDMNRLLLDDLDPRHGRGSTPGGRVEGRVSIHPSARIASSVIRGPVVVGANATVEDAFVGPYTAIGEGARIEGAEIENSIVFPGAVVLHVGARLESCVIGRDARVERRFSVPRAMRLQLGDSTSVLLG
jgi:glucose-1-phosphate thymidylyltransferase